MFKNVNNKEVAITIIHIICKSILILSKNSRNLFEKNVFVIIKVVLNKYR